MTIADQPDNLNIEQTAEKKSTVSVIIPTFNRTAYIADAIASVFAQTAPILEIIVIDDGSSDTVRQTLKIMTDQYPSVSLHSLPENMGVSHARNNALKFAAGDYILFLDDDDRLHPNMIASALELLEKDQTLTGVFCLYNYENSGTSSLSAPNLKLIFNYQKLKQLSTSFRSPEYFTNNQLEKETAYTFLRSTIAIHSCLLRRATIDKTCFPENLVFGEDKFFWLSLALKGCKFKVIPNTFCTIRRHSTNHSRYSFRNEKEKQLVYYETLVQQKMLPCRRSRAFIFLKLVHVRFILGRPQHLNELAMLIMAPDMIFKELFLFFKRRLTLRWQYFRFCLRKKKIAI